MHIENFFSDFPSRCGELLQAYELIRSAEVVKRLEQGLEDDKVREALSLLRQREVTFLLMTASAALTIPYELLIPDDLAKKLDSRRKPAERDRKHAMRQAGENADEKQAMGDFLSRDFRCLDLNTSESMEWAYFEFDGIVSKEARMNWAIQKYVALPANMKVSEVAECLRNALAHGNVQTGQDGGRIIYLFFVSGMNNENNPYKCVRVSPDMLRRFLNEWVDFLRAIGWEKRVRRQHAI